MGTEKNYILSKEVIAKKLRRMAYEILENNIDEKELILAGIRESGSVLAHIDYLQDRLAAFIHFSLMHLKYWLCL